MTNLESPRKPILKPDFENIPAELKAGKWCCWKAVPKSNGKIDKIPYNPRFVDKIAYTTKPETFATFEEAVDRFNKSDRFSGIGRLIEKDGIFGGDIDTCMTDDGRLHPEARSIVNRLETYVEYSPGGAGLRLFGYGSFPGPDFNNTGLGVEMYAGDEPRFLTITGRVFEERCKFARPDKDVLDRVYEDFRTRVVADEDSTPMPELLDSSDLPDLELTGIPPRNLSWLLNGFDRDADRSKDLQATTKELYKRGLSDGEVLSILFESPGSLEIAEDHWGSRTDKVLRYLWKHHCLTARHLAAELDFDPINDPGDEAGKDPVKRFLKRYIYVEKGDGVCDLKRPPHAMMIRLSEFKNSTANIRHDVADPIKADPERTRKAPVHAAWLVHPNRKTAHAEAYAPKRQERLFQDEQGLWWVNCYHVPQHKPHSGCDNLDVFSQHMDYLLPHDAERRWFLDWLAFIIQRPQQRCKVTPLHVSTLHGTGRGWVVELIQKLLGHWNCTKTKMDALCGEGSAGQFNSYLHNSLVCFVEEAKESGRRWAVSDKIRGALTENTLPINRKYVGETTEDVHTNFFMMTNRRDALVLTNEDRRIQVLSGPDWLQDAGYYDRLYSWLSSDGPSQLYHWLSERDISKFDWRRSSDTPARRWMVESNRSLTEELFWAVMENLPAPGLTKEQFRKAMIAASENDAFDTEINERELVKLLREHAVDKRQIKVKSDWKPQIWVLNRTLKTNNRENNSIIRQGVIDYGL